jgi:hypothetical protein
VDIQTRTAANRRRLADFFDGVTDAQLRTSVEVLRGRVACRR